MCSFLASTFLKLMLRLAHVNYYLQPRGPDYTGTASLGGFAFVHNLLHMTGSMTLQPLVSADNRTVAVFNGEIYNFRQLQEVLRPRGPPYASDSQCILDAYQHWGVHFSRHFQGEFAIAVFDFSAARIVVTTDPFGVKPVFVAETQSAFGVSSYRSGLQRAGHPDGTIVQLPANSVHVYRYKAGPNGLLTDFTLARQHTLVEWDLRQHKSHGDDWEVAFESAVRARTEGAFRGVFLALSSGYDSGAIHLAMLRLGVSHATYSILGAETTADHSLIRERVAFAQSFQKQQAAADEAADGAPSVPAASVPSLGSFIVRVNSSAYKATHKTLQERCEPYVYTVPRFSQPVLRQPSFVPGTRLGVTQLPMLKDSAAMGVGHICSLATGRGQRVMLTGSGADETMTDYGFQGVRFAEHSHFGGRWPNDTALAALFPWEDFYGGSQRNFLAKDEYVTGAFGVEGRFPFLDARVVQEQLHLTAELKNTYYKAASQLYMRKHGYPHEPCIATAQTPFGDGPGCKKVGFLVPKRPRQKGATSGCIGPACKPWF